MELNDIINDHKVIDSTEMSAQINEIASALSIAQGEFETSKKGQAGYGYNYADLSTVIQTAKPVLEKHGLAVVQLVGKSDGEGNIGLTTILTHKSGQYFKSNSTMPVVEMKGVNSAQQMGATISYLRRYAYQAILGLSSEDNDASSKGMSKPSGKTSFSGDKPAAKKPVRQKFRDTQKKEVSSDDII